LPRGRYTARRAARVNRRNVSYIRVGIAGWSNPPAERRRRAGAQSHLSYYAQQFNCVEINSSFYREHQRKTYERWRDSTAARFRFSVKMPRSITHESALRRTRREVSQFFSTIQGLQPKLGAVLIQLPPGLEFAASTARAFFESLPRLPDTFFVCEPRHMSWFSERADAVLCRANVSRAAVDPAVVEVARVPGGDRRFSYFRWHGSPHKYYSSYGAEQLTTFAATVCERESKQAWCIFDNTARYAAWQNAVSIKIAFNRL
jgi:uncharacterized protein YecE (DUF72 family)